MLKHFNKYPYGGLYTKLRNIHNFTLLHWRGFSTKNQDAYVTYPMGSPFPKLNIPLETSTAIFSLRPWFTVNHLAKFFREEDPSVKSVKFFHIPERLDSSSTDLSEIPIEKWSSSTTMEDILRAGLQVKATKDPDSSNSPTISDPGFLVEINGKRIHVKMPKFEERTREHVKEIESLELQITPMQKVKDLCDKKAHNHSERLVWGGLVGLSAQFVVLARLTWWEYSWDVIEPITWFVGSGNAILAYGFFMIYRRDFTCETLSNITATKKQLKLYRKNNLDISKYADLMERKGQIEGEIHKIQKEYQ